jgi:hypothetical protein
VIKFIVDILPWLAMIAWFGLLIYESERARPKIVALQDFHDPNHEFVRKQNFGLGFAGNSYWVDKKNPRCTPEFLTEWDKVYGAHWRRIYIGLLLLPVAILLGRLLRFILNFAGQLWA